MPFDTKFPDPGAYDISDLGDWPEVQAILETRISHYQGDYGTIMAAHHMRVAAEALGFLMYLDYPMKVCLNIKAALLIHDIGKTHNAYAPEIWSLPHRPSDVEKTEKRLHTRRGVTIFNQVLARFSVVEAHPHADLCRAVILYHHERLNGSLYENRTDLPEWLQVCCIVDTYDGDRIRRPHQDHRRSPQETIARMMAEGDDGDKYDGAFDHDLLEKFAKYTL